MPIGQDDNFHHYKSELLIRIKEVPMCVAVSVVFCERASATLAVAQTVLAKG